MANQPCEPSAKYHLVLIPGDAFSVDAPYPPSPQRIVRSTTIGAEDVRTTVAAVVASSPGIVSTLTVTRRFAGRVSACGNHRAILTQKINRDGHVYPVRVGEQEVGIEKGSSGAFRKHKRLLYAAHHDEGQLAPRALRVERAQTELVDAHFQRLVGKCEWVAARRPEVAFMTELGTEPHVDNARTIVRERTADADGIRQHRDR